jgi:hypothetical protein
MIEPIRWTDRTWTFSLPVRAFPAVLERLRGTAARAHALTAGASEQTLATRVGDAWSVKQHIGHLDDLHELDDTRLDEFLSRVDVLTAADMTNRRTDTAGHDQTPMADLITRLRDHREALVIRMEALTEEEVGIASVHPRLGQPVRLIDWACFVAEHDDHHLAAARRVLTRVSSGTLRS